MEDLPSPLGFRCLDEAIKGCVRIRLYHYETDDGSGRHAVELMAWNRWINSGKLLFFAGGLDGDYARYGFEAARHDIKTYSWTENELVFEDR
jgi:hypothetical protein